MDFGLIELAYMVAALCFIFGIKRLSKVKTSAAGNRLAAFGMLFAIVATMFLLYGDVALWIIIAGVAVGGALGGILAKRVPMTAMPELVAFFNGMGGAASMLVALAEIAKTGAVMDGNALVSEGAWTVDVGIAVAASILIGTVTLSGSLIAYAKLAGKFDKTTIGPIGTKPVNAVLVLVCLGVAYWTVFSTGAGFGVALGTTVFLAAALLLGVGLTTPIGGADMPVAISLLNSYSGLAASATGFVLQNNLLIIAGSLVGAAGLILTKIMCKAMNRSLANVLFGGMAEQAAAAKDDGYTSVKSTTAEELAPLLDAAGSVIVVPGYGLAVAQAQHRVRELASLLQANGCDVKYAIHPVAGRMPGHMNILLAEADVPYEELFELDAINDDFGNCDVAIVIGANDVCNPAANDDPNSPIAGMPVLNVWDAQTVVVIKRSLSAGYAGIKNELFQLDNSLMLFGDAKQALEDTIAELKDQ